ncbi:MAG: septum formation initiator family protein [Clostridia bacterium]|nr:septum formation initiator family protein [Clostridia bacterium]
MANGAYMYADRGYDLSLFESEGNAARKVKAAPKRQTAKKNNVIELNMPEYEKSERRKHNIGSIVLGFVCAAIVTLCVGLIIRGQVELTELNQEIVSAQVQLEEAKSEYTQMQAKMEASLSTAAIEKYARENLGMSKATAHQKEYISLSEGDKAEVYTQKKSNVFTEIGDFFQSLWS